MIYMKRLFIFFLLSVGCLTGANHSIAAEIQDSVVTKERYAKVDQNALTVVSYEQSSKDNQATLLIKNNTEEKIRRAITITSLKVMLKVLYLRSNMS